LDDVHVFSSQMADDGWVRGEGRKRILFILDPSTNSKQGSKVDHWLFATLAKEGCWPSPHFLVVMFDIRMPLVSSSISATFYIRILPIRTTIDQP